VLSLLVSSIKTDFFKGGTSINEKEGRDYSTTVGNAEIVWVCEKSRFLTKKVFDGEMWLLGFEFLNVSSVSASKSMLLRVRILQHTVQSQGHG
jgi:hypothetical protein